MKIIIVITITLTEPFPPLPPATVMKMRLIFSESVPHSRFANNRNTRYEEAA